MAPITHIEKKKLNYFYLVLHGSSGGCLKHLPDALLALGRAREVDKGVDPQITRIVADVLIVADEDDVSGGDPSINGS